MQDKMHGKENTLASGYSLAYLRAFLTPTLTLLLTRFASGSFMRGPIPSTSSQSFLVRRKSSTLLMGPY